MKKLTATQIAMEESMRKQQQQTLEILKEIQKMLLKLNDLITLLITPQIQIKD